MAGQNADRQRFERYQQVVREVCARADFILADLKQACADQHPALVTRIVRKLESDGLLVREGPSTRASFRWVGNRESFQPRLWIQSQVMGDRLTRSPQEDRPRERLLARGAAELRTAELLAILIRSGRAGESALQAGEKIVARYADQLDQLAGAGRGELKELAQSVGDTAFCQIMAGIELGRRVVMAGSGAQPPPPRLTSSDDAQRYCAERFTRLATDARHEELHVVLLNTKNQPFATYRVSVGSLDASLAHPREIFRPAIKEAAKSMILVHNHPSGDPTPGDEDLRVTRRLMEVAKIVGIEVLDHIVVARSGTASIRQHQLASDR